MNLELEEMRFGRYANQMAFSGITVCTTLTCVMSAGNRLLGGHFSLQRPPLEYDAILKGMKALVKSGGGQIAEMYIVRVQDTWAVSKFAAGILKDGRLVDTEQATTFRKALGYTGVVRCLQVTGKNYGEFRQKGGKKKAVPAGGNLVSVMWQEAKQRVKIYVDGYNQTDYFETA